MHRTLKILLVLSAILVLEWLPAPAQAGPRISPNNPYRSYNLSGVNYGSQQWEKTHRNTSSSSSRVKRGFLRRR